MVDLTDVASAWTLTGNAFPPNEETEIGYRMISEEPMYLVRSIKVELYGADCFYR